jgi:hypothetical protein
MRTAWWASRSPRTSCASPASASASTSPRSRPTCSPCRSCSAFVVHRQGRAAQPAGAASMAAKLCRVGAKGALDGVVALGLLRVHPHGLTLEPTGSISSTSTASASTICLLLPSGYR